MLTPEQRTALEAVQSATSRIADLAAATEALIAQAGLTLPHKAIRTTASQAHFAAADLLEADRIERIAYGITARDTDQAAAQLQRLARAA